MEDATDPQLSRAPKSDDRDMFRDTSIRFLGYANELGESFKNVISKTVYRSSYGVAISYVLADAFDKARKEHQREPKAHLQISNGPQRNPQGARLNTLVANSVSQASVSTSGSEAPTSSQDPKETELSNQRASLDAPGGRSNEQSEHADGTATSGGRTTVSEAGDGDTWRAATAGLDALLWHGLATVAIPGFTINRAVWLTTRLLDNLEKRRVEKLTTGQSKPVNPRAPAALRRWIPAAVGLSLIPIIVKPIDRSMDRFMDVAVRPYLGTPKHTM